SNEADDAEVAFSPNIKSNGPATPPLKIAPASQPSPEPRRPASLGVPLSNTDCRNRQDISPRPDPSYKSPARRTGSSEPSRLLASGVLAPNRTAADSASMTPFHECAVPVNLATHELCGSIPV